MAQMIGDGLLNEDGHMEDPDEIDPDTEAYLYSLIFHRDIDHFTKPESTQIKTADAAPQVKEHPKIIKRNELKRRKTSPPPQPSGTDDVDLADHSVAEIRRIVGGNSDDWKICDLDKACFLRGSRYYFEKKSPSGVQCKRCKQHGHHMRYCTVEMEPVCFICAGKHSAYTCRHIICSFCFKTGHEISDCEKAANLFGSKTCKRCGHYSHIYRHCPENWRQFHSTISANATRLEPINKWNQRKDSKVKYCYRCAGKGHFGHECSVSQPPSPYFCSEPYVYYYETLEEIDHRICQSYLQKGIYQESSEYDSTIVTAYNGRKATNVALKEDRIAFFEAVGRNPASSTAVHIPKNRKIYFDGNGDVISSQSTEPPKKKKRKVASENRDVILHLPTKSAENRRKTTTENGDASLLPPTKPAKKKRLVHENADAPSLSSAKSAKKKRRLMTDNGEVVSLLTKSAKKKKRLMTDNGEAVSLITKSAKKKKKRKSNITISETKSPQPSFDIIKKKRKIGTAESLLPASSIDSVVKTSDTLPSSILFVKHKKKKLKAKTSEIGQSTQSDVFGSTKKLQFASDWKPCALPSIGFKEKKLKLQNLSETVSATLPVSNGLVKRTNWTDVSVDCVPDTSRFGTVKTKTKPKSEPAAVPSVVPSSNSKKRKKIKKTLESKSVLSTSTKIVKKKRKFLSVVPFDVDEAN